MVTIREAALNMPDEYVSVSTRLPKIDADLLSLLCKKQGTTPSKYIRDLIKKNISSPQRKFLAGKNKIYYNKLNNTFSWTVELDSGAETEVLKSLSDDFLKNLKQEIEKSLQERNDWVHHSHDDSVDIPGELVGDEEDGT